MPTTEIILTQGKTAIIDVDDLELVSGLTWCAARSRGKWYVQSRTLGHETKMHRLIAGAAEGEVVDHINGNGLDNRRDNLRRCSQAENLCNMQGPQRNNQLGVLGVNRIPSGYRVRITKGGVQLHVGVFSTIEEAMVARREAAELLHGQFAARNIVRAEMKS